MVARRVLIVGAGPFQCDLIRTVQRAGHVAIVVDGAADAPGLMLADVAHVCDVRDEAGVVALARAARVEAVLSAASDAALSAVVAVGEALALPALSRQSLARGRDKLATFRALSVAGLAAPFTCKVPDSHAELLLLVLRNGGFPCVIKPRSSAGGRGVSIVHTEAELEHAVARARAVAGTDPHNGALLQAFVKGRSIGVEACFFGGSLVRAFPIGDQYVPGFVSPVGHALPVALSSAELATVHHTVLGWGRALGVDHGVVNFDARLDGPLFTLLEANLRPGGSSITELLRASLGVDISLVALRCALGIHPREALTPSASARPAASRIVLLPRVAAIVEHRPLPDSARGPEVLLAERTAVGATPPEVNGRAVAGRCLVRADSAERAVLAAEALAELLAQSMGSAEDHLGAR